jgi:ppGpp synthetase/RelA/SpoT-type nucleotidyltranferase
MKVRAPAEAARITEFIRGSEKRYVAALGEVKSRLLAAKQSNSELSCIYSIYSRGEKQIGSELKHPRKIRLKIDKYCSDNGTTEYDIFSMPDIVGVTVSVSFPTDINVVNKLIDGWIANGAICAVYYDKDNATKNPSRHIITSYGNVKAEAGYYACHYYLRMRNNSREPIVEIQIKTLLHDAWGLITHDLTYKPTTSLSRELVEHFSLLGDQLSKIDSQGDILRKTIRRVTKVRESKKRAVQVATLKSAINNLFSLPGDAAAPKAMATVLGEILAHEASHGRIDCTNQELIDYINRTIVFFDAAPAPTCLLLCLLAVMSDDRAAKLQALEYIDIWAMEAHDPKSLAQAKSYAHLAHFCFSDTPTAIEQADDALIGLAKISRPQPDAAEEELICRRENSLFSSLAYYHAEIVGSDEGIKRSSHNMAREYAMRSVSKMVELKLMPEVRKTIEDNVDAMLGIVSAGDYAGPLFHSIDNLIFVLIQTSSAVDKLEVARELLRKSAANHPSDLGSLPGLLLEFHTYCVRQRLTELELQGVDG